MASIPDTFVVSLLDCCRMPVVFGEEGEGEREREEKREEKHDPRATDYFGGDCVRIYSTSAGTATLERCEKTEKGSKITCKFIKHAKTYGFPEFPHGTSFWAFMQVCLQYQVDVKQYGTKSVNLTTLSLSKIDTLRTYQKMFLMTKKEIDFLYSQFKRLDKDESLSISPHELLHDLTIFGFNYKKEEIDAIPHLSKNKKNNLEIFLKKWKEEVEKIQQLDKDTTRLSFEEFLLLFVRSQTNLHWNDLLPPYYKEKKNYLLCDYSRSVIASRWQPVLVKGDPRYQLYLEKQKETQISSKTQSPRTIETPRPPKPKPQLKHSETERERTYFTSTSQKSKRTTHKRTLARKHEDSQSDLIIGKKPK